MGIISVVYCLTKIFKKKYMCVFEKYMWQHIYFINNIFYRYKCLILLCQNAYIGQHKIQSQT